MAELAVERLTNPPAIHPAMAQLLARRMQNALVFRLGHDRYHFNLAPSDYIGHRQEGRNGGHATSQILRRNLAGRRAADQTILSPTLSPRVRRKMKPITLFSFGYDGWGNATPQLIQAVDAVERNRGFNPPIFVDTRIRRSGRAEGFKAAAFESLLPAERHRWMKRLGNQAIIDRRYGKIEIADPGAAHDLVDLAHEATKHKQRLIFFCNCPWPRQKGQVICHRAEVAKLVLKAAKKRGLHIQVAEWPGDEPTAIDLWVSSEILDAVKRGRKTIPLGTQAPEPSLLGLPWYSVVVLHSGSNQLRAACGPAQFSRHGWCLPVQRLYDGREFNPASVAKDVVRDRKAFGLNIMDADDVKRPVANARQIGLLRKSHKTAPEYMSECVYTILHSRDLSNLYRSGRGGVFTEYKKWVTAEKLLRNARSAGRIVPIIFAPGENIWELTHFAELDDIKIAQNEEGRWSTTVSISNLTKIRPPRPKKTRLTVCSTGARLPSNHIRPYVMVETPSFLLKKAAKK